ncbi:hypothetical protein HDR60_00580 [bacterium]|nr:hypothetical protein [bacterium]
MYKITETNGQVSYTEYANIINDFPKGTIIEEIDSVPTPAYKLSYTYKRQEEYPSINEQLDMIYWDKINGTNNWETKITEIKNKYPKE